MGITKSLGQKDELDRFYTNAVTVEQCMELVDLDRYDIIIEPSAGTGAFTEFIEKSHRCFSYDIDPKKNNIIKADWLTLDKSPFVGKVLVIGNPPFGVQGSMAKAFFNESATFATTIAFILPLSFKKPSQQGYLDFNFTLDKELLLPDCQFYLMDKTICKIPCVFQVWERSETQREPYIPKTDSKILQFVSPNEADFRIQRVGSRAGKASFDLNRATSSNYFVKNISKFTNEELVDLINNKLVFPTVAYAIGPKSLSKTELVAVCDTLT